jgi:DNA (cytosine-5)-methyltransferase 1
MKSKNPNSGCREVDIAQTLDTSDPNPSKNQGGIAIVAPFDTTNITSKINASRVDYGEPCHTLQSNAHPPAAVIALEGNASRPSHKGAGIANEGEPMYTLNTVDRHAVAKAEHDNGDSTTVREGAIVRRLTPTECERLQGFPDGWTELGHDNKLITDSKRYAAIGNSVAIPVVDYIMQGIVEVAEK